MHEVYRRCPCTLACRYLPVERAVACAAGPSDAVLAVSRDGARREIEVCVAIRFRGPVLLAMECGGSDRDGVPGALQESPLQAECHLHTAERIGVLVGDDEDVHGALGYAEVPR